MFGSKYMQFKDLKFGHGSINVELMNNMLFKITQSVITMQHMPNASQLAGLMLHGSHLYCTLLRIINLELTTTTIIDLFKDSSYLWKMSNLHIIQ